MSESTMTHALDAAASKSLDATLADWNDKDKIRRLWNADGTLWPGSYDDKEAPQHWLGWLRAVEQARGQLATLKAIAADVKSAGFKHALLLGMGGSSLCPEVLRLTYGVVSGRPELHVLDSTVPAQVMAIEAKLDLTKTICIVSSKSGSTTEPNVFRQYFQDRIQQAIGAEPAGRRFIAVTDPNTKMQRVAEENGFRHIAFGVPSIGGRFSALSNFGLVPAAVMGLDVEDFLDRAGRMTAACGPDTRAEANPGVLLGAILGTIGKAGRDKVTIVTSPAIGDLGAWLEQLIAESTGKSGTGLVPIADEELGPPSVYGGDRVFAYVRLASQPLADQDRAINTLQSAGHPVVRIELNDARDLGAEFFRWEIATAVAGSILGINAFNQPDVEASKIKTRELSDAYAKTRQAPTETPIAETKGLRLFTDEANAKSLGGGDAIAMIKAHLNRLAPGDYFATNAYVEMNDENRRVLQEMRHRIRDTRKVATTLGFGPRFLHSTGQLHKGGPNTGVFLQITSDDAADLPIPGEVFTFGLLKRFQAQGDFDVLTERKRRALRVHLGADVAAGLATLAEILRGA